MKSVYIVLTDTGTVLTNCIKIFTRKNYNHSSIALDKQLDNVYSFGREKVNNPFKGGFVKENLYQDFFLRSRCQVYHLEMSEEHFERMQEKITEFELNRTDYRYNFIGLIGIALRQEWERENAFFCSQFLAYILQESGRVEFHKPIYLVTSDDLVASLNPQLIYQGTVSHYLASQTLYAENQEGSYETQYVPQTFTKKWTFPVINRFFKLPYY